MTCHHIATHEITPHDEVESAVAVIVVIVIIIAIIIIIFFIITNIFIMIALSMVAGHTVMASMQVCKDPSLVVLAFAQSAISILN